jgi:undecaprenyl diphosphate synthase
MLMAGRLPKHVAFSGISSVCSVDALLHALDVAKIVMGFNIPVVSFLVYPLQRSKAAVSEDLDSLHEFFLRLSEDHFLSRHKVKVSIIGRWYDLPGRITDSIKAIIDSTRDYDSFFLNLCVNYDGQEEIAMACQIVSRMVRLDKLDPDAVTPELIKENSYSSYFIPPDMMIVSGDRRSTEGLFLLDLSNSVIFFAGVSWKSFDRHDLLRAFSYYEAYRGAF